MKYHAVLRTSLSGSSLWRFGDSRLCSHTWYVTNTQEPDPATSHSDIFLGTHIYAVIPQIKFSRYQSFVIFIIPFNIIWSQGGREGEINDFISKRKLSFWQVNVISNHPKVTGTWAHFFWLQGQASTLPFPRFPRRQFKCINGVKVLQVSGFRGTKAQQCGDQFLFSLGVKPWLWSSQKLS